jgi:hypothetical protein
VSRHFIETLHIVQYNRLVVECLVQKCLRKTARQGCCWVATWMAFSAVSARWLIQPDADISFFSAAGTTSIIIVIVSDALTWNIRSVVFYFTQLRNVRLLHTRHVMASHDLSTHVVRRTGRHNRKSIPESQRKDTQKNETDPLPPVIKLPVGFRVWRGITLHLRKNGEQD